MTNSISDVQPLRRYNFIAAIVHTVQGIIILALANGFSLPVKGSFMTGPPGTAARKVEVLFSIRTAWAVAAFLFLSAIAHFLVAGPLWNKYTHQLSLSRNPYRWAEYSISSSIMILLIAQLTGIDDIAALIGLVGVNAAMIGFGWLQERFERPGGGWWPFGIGCFAGIVPWIAIGIYLASPGTSQGAPGFVYGIFFSLFFFFNIFALNQWLQYRQVGRWRNYLYGERVYITLSLVAKSLLAWQIFASALASSSVH
jgi:hypothetical protein